MIVDFTFNDKNVSENIKKAEYLLRELQVVVSDLKLNFVNFEITPKE